MGGSSSKATITSLSETINSAVMSTIQSCETTSDQSQNLTVVNEGWKLFGSYRLEQQSDIKASCFSDAQKQTDIQNKIINEIKQASTASSIALLGAFGSSTSDATANLTNIVRNNVTMSNIQQSYIAIKQKQSATFINKGVMGFEQAELVQGSKLFAAATLQEIDKAGIFNTIESYVDQKSTASQENPLEFISRAIGSVVGGISSTIMWIVIIIAIALFGIIAVMKMLTPEERDEMAPSGMPGRDKFVKGL